MRVAFFGASGKVGRETLRGLLTDHSANDYELVLIARNSNRIAGIVSDIESITPLHGPNRNPHRMPSIRITNDPRDVEGADLVVLSAATWPTVEQKREFYSLDPSGRLVQAYQNFNLVQQISHHINQYAKEATLIIVTNQSDMMAEAAREILPPNKVLGFGGIVDSTRLRYLIKKHTLYIGDGLDSVHVIGYHNTDMTVAKESLPKIFRDSSEIEEIITKTRAYGGNISKLQKDYNYPEIDTGASILPGYALFKTIIAWTQGLEIRESFNVRLKNPHASDYGLENDSALSVPIKIRMGGYDILPSVASRDQMQHLIDSQERMRRAYEKLVLDMQRRKANFPQKDLSPNSEVKLLSWMGAP